MKKYLIFLFFALQIGCNNNPITNNNTAIVSNYVDSIYELSRPVLMMAYEDVKVIEYPYNDSSNVKRKMWIYGDSIDKYCTNDKLIQLASSHESKAVRYVAFKLLMKRDSHEAINLLINDIDNTDTVCATRLDESFPETLTSLRVELAQYRKLYNISVEDSISVDNAILKSKHKNSIKYYRSLVKKLAHKGVPL